jgi:hypothetical protein
MAQQDPALRDQQPWKSAVDRDMTWFRTAITKHCGGDESDMPALAKGVLTAFEGSRPYLSLTPQSGAWPRQLSADALLDGFVRSG